MKFTLLLLFTISAFSQVVTGPRTLKGRQDASTAVSTAPMVVGTTLPLTCVVGDLFFKSNATAGQNIYECQSTDIWTQQLNSGSGGGGITGLTTGAPVAAASATTVATPCTTCTFDASGNLGTPGGISVGVGGSVGGVIELGQGTAPTAGTTSVKLYAPAAVTSYIVTLPGVAASGFWKWSNSAGTVTSSVGTLPRGISFSLGDEFGPPLAVGGAGSTDYITVPFACTISAFNLVTDASDTSFRVKFWKIATGTAKPTSANSISTSGVGVPSGTALHSTTLSDFTSLTVTANDMVAMALSTSNTVKMISGVLQCDQQ